MTSALIATIALLALPPLPAAAQPREVVRVGGGRTLVLWAVPGGGEGDPKRQGAGLWRRRGERWELLWARRYPRLMFSWVARGDVTRDGVDELLLSYSLGSGVCGPHHLLDPVRARLIYRRYTCHTYYEIRNGRLTSQRSVTTTSPG